VLKCFFYVLENAVHKPRNGSVNMFLIFVNHIGNDCILELLHKCSIGFSYGEYGDWKTKQPMQEFLRIFLRNMVTPYLYGH